MPAGDRGIGALDLVLLFGRTRRICAHFTGRNRSDPLRRRRSGLSQEALYAAAARLPGIGARPAADGHPRSIISLPTMSCA